jgi:hypothetical protein
MRASEFVRVGDAARDAGTLVLRRGVVAWHLTAEWSAATTTRSGDGEFVRTSTISDPTASAALGRDDDARMHERLVALLVDALDASHLVESIIADLLDEPTYANEHVQRARNCQLRGAPIPPVWLVNRAGTALRHAGGELTTQRARDALAMTAANPGTSRAVAHEVARFFTIASDLRCLIADVTRWVDANGRPLRKELRRERTIDLCVEPYCREPVPTPRRGRCMACYQWTRRWSADHDGQPAPPVPPTVIEARHERRQMAEVGS